MEGESRGICLRLGQICSDRAIASLQPVLGSSKIISRNVEVARLYTEICVHLRQCTGFLVIFPKTFKINIMGSLMMHGHLSVYIIVFYSALVPG